MLQNIKKNKQGASIIEITIVIFIIILLSVGIILTYTSFRKEMDLGTATNQIINDISLTASKTLASENDASYGIHFTTTSYTIFAGSVYNPLDTGNETQNLSNGLQISNINLNGGGTDIIFFRLTASTSNFGSITLSQTDNPSASSTIDILPSGQAGLTQALSPVDSRIVDSRHTHFDLGWSIQGANTLTLTFLDPPNPNVVQNINMESYFNEDETEFDWQGTVNVNGENQSIRIHTHYVGVTDTNLCIHRDGRYNDKALEVSIDGKQIVSYSSSSTPSVEAWGGTMEIQ